MRIPVISQSCMETTDQPSMIWSPYNIGTNPVRMDALYHNFFCTFGPARKSTIPLEVGVRHTW